MRTRASNQLCQISGIAIVILCAAVVTLLLDRVPTSSGSANDYAPAVKLSVAPAQGSGAIEAPADPAHGSSDSPNRPTCAELGGIEKAGESSGAVGCGARIDVAGGTPARNRNEQVDAGSFLAWHLQAREEDAVRSSNLLLSARHR